MIDPGTQDRERQASGRNSRWIQCGVLGAVCALVIGIYAVASQSGGLELMSLNSADTYYNLLVQGFRAGQLNLKKEVPPGFAQLADPYDSAANARYRSEPYGMLDMSYYKGRLYFYFGVTPAVILFWPYATLTGYYLFHRQAVFIFCSIGFLAGVGLLGAVWRRYFAEVSVGVVAACALALGLATGVPLLLSRSDVYEASISCGYMLVMLSLAALWRVLHEPEPRKSSGWLVAASVAYGLAVGARPNLLFGAVILLVPVVRAWRERKPVGGLLVAATGPMVMVGLGMMLYNYLRFDNPFEFGVSYQLAADQRDTRQSFSWRYLWFNVRVYFLEPVRWSRRFPFVRGIVLPNLPAGHHGNVEYPFGVLSTVPLVWLALAAPLAWGGRSPRLSGPGSTLRRSGRTRDSLSELATALTLLFVASALTMGVYYAAASRFELEFLPALMLLAVMGIFGLERSRPSWRPAARCVWGLLLGYSVTFNLLASVENTAKAHYYTGITLFRAGRIQEAVEQYERALRLKPELAEAHNSLGNAAAKEGRIQEAIVHYEDALRIKPDYADAHHNLGLLLERAGRSREAIEEFEQALRIEPGRAETHNNLGVALDRIRREEDAVGHLEEALGIRPDYAEAQYNLGHALLPLGRVREALGHYEQAVRINPDYADAWNALGAALAQTGRLDDAVGSWLQAVRINPDLADAHYNLGIALEQLGRVKEAIQHYQQVARLKPEDAGVKSTLARLQAGQE